MTTACPAADLAAMSASAAADDDASLLARWRAGDGAALERLIGRHGALVRGACRRRIADPALADDAAQAVFIVLARRGAGVRDAHALRGGPAHARGLVAHAHGQGGGRGPARRARDRRPLVRFVGWAGAAGRAHPSGGPQEIVWALAFADGWAYVDSVSRLRIGSGPAPADAERRPPANGAADF